MPSAVFRLTWPNYLETKGKLLHLMPWHDAFIQPIQWVASGWRCNVYIWVWR
jgi:hypothetical protein